MSTAKRTGGGTSSGIPGLWQRIWQPFWAIPVTAVVVATIAGLLLPEVDGRVAEDVPWWFFGGGPDSARGILSTIATAMISVTGLVFSITMVVLQLAASQYTPRVLGTFLSSRIVQSTLAIFMSSFVFALTVLRSVRGGNDGFEHAIPQISVTISFLLVLGSIGAFLLFINHITSSIQVGQIVSAIGDTTLRAVDEVFPEDDDEGDDDDGDDGHQGGEGEQGGDGNDQGGERRGGARRRGTGSHRVGPQDADLDGGARSVWSPNPRTPSVEVHARGRHGLVTSIHYDHLIDLADEHDVIVELTVGVGDFVPDGFVIGRVWGRDDLSGDTLKKITKSISLASERTIGNDVAFGLRQLTDITERGLATGTNDPTTAIQGINEIHRIFRRLVQRRSPSPYITTDEGDVRVVHRPQTVDGLLRSVVPELAFYGAESARLPATIEAMLRDLRTVALPGYRPTLDVLVADLPDEPLDRSKAR